MSSDDHSTHPYLAELVKKWGMAKLSRVSHYSPNSIYQWSPARSPIPPDAALRVCAHSDAGHLVEELCPALPWHLVYGGIDRRTSYENLASNVEEAIKQVGVTAVARAAGRSRQNIYEAMRYPECPVWLALALEQASQGRYLAEDWRADLPWYQLYGKTDRQQNTLVLTGQGKTYLVEPKTPCQSEKTTRDK